MTDSLAQLLIDLEIIRREAMAGLVEQYGPEKAAEIWKNAGRLPATDRKPALALEPRAAA